MNNKIRVGGEIVQYYYSESPYGSYINTLGKSDPTFSGDALTYMFIQLKNQVGWNAFKSAFRFINDKKISVPQSNKFYMFMSILGDYTNGYDPLSVFTNKQLNVIKAAVA